MGLDEALAKGGRGFGGRPPPANDKPTTMLVHRYSLSDAGPLVCTAPNMAKDELRPRRPAGALSARFRDLAVALRVGMHEVGLEGAIRDHVLHHRLDKAHA